MRRIVVLAAAVFAFSAAGAGAHIAPTWNGGYANGGGRAALAIRR